MPAQDKNARSPRSRLPVLLGLTVGYVASGALGSLLAVPPGYATAIFPPAGLAVAATFIGGARTLPWIFVGSILLNLYIGTASVREVAEVDAANAAIIASASMLQAGLGGWALRRLVRYPAAIDNARDLWCFLLLTPVVCLTSASLSLAAMWALGAIEPAYLALSWLTWWLGDTLGVLVVFPLVMVFAGEPRHIWRERAWRFALPILLVFALFAAIFVKVNKDDQSLEALLKFWLPSQQITDRIEKHLKEREAFLEQLQRSFASRSSPVTREDFRALTRDMRQRFPAVQAAAWAPRVVPAQRNEFEALQQRDLPRFQIRERDAFDAHRYAQTRDIFYPVTYVEPLQGNEEALGFDLASDIARRDAIVKAVESGTVVATAPLHLVQVPSDKNDLLLVLTIPDSPNGPGIVVLALRMGNLLESVLGGATMDIDFQLIDRDSGLSLFGAAPVSIRQFYEHSFTFAGRTYVARAAPTKAYLASYRGWQSQAMLMAGVLSPGLLGALLMLATGERRRLEALLRDRTRERDRIWQVSEDLLAVGNFEGYLLSFNPAWTHVLGWSEDEIRRMHVDEVRHPDDRAGAVEARKRLAEGVPTVRFESRLRCKHGGYRSIHWTAAAEGGLIYFVGRDVTAEKTAAATLHRAEEQLRQSQKMQALGQLTGGIAHDFNNLLTVIIGGLEIVERSTAESAGKIRKVVSAAMTGAFHAATLTQRLLAYAQKQRLNPRIVDLNQLIVGMADLIRQTHGESIECNLALGDNVGSCFCDPSQLETAVLNLVINARDAMPQGGKLKIQTTVTVIEDAPAAARELPSGSYVTLLVSDTGIGMSPDTRAHAFEPFFTTKGPGQGTGLGLSTVYGFVKQSHGHVDIDSKLDQGTTVRILLPSAAPVGLAKSVAPAADSARSLPSKPGESILLVEDDEQVRLYVADMLRSLGYHVVVAESAEAAIVSMTQTRERFDLLLTDVVLPGMNGRVLADRAREIRPGIKVLFMTGYSRDVIVHEGRLDPGIDLIEKPFRQEALATRIRVILDQSVSSRTESSEVMEPIPLRQRTRPP